MRHRLSGRHLGRETSHRIALYRNLVTDLLRYERITTTEAKAKEIRPMAEKIITLGRRGDLHARRQALGFLYDPRVAKKVFDDIAPRMANRPGGYLRITGLEPRKGDGAKMAVIELVDYVDAPATPRPQRVTASPIATPSPSASRTAAAEPEAAAPPETLVEDEAEAPEPADVEATVAEAEGAVAQAPADDAVAEAPDAVVDSEAVVEDTPPADAGDAAEEGDAEGEE
ncbi:MAG: 50S ribosomal protein L17 [Tepidiformaceae bacterium]